MLTSAVQSGVRDLTASQLAAARAIMRLFAEEDVANGVSPRQRLYCDACQRGRPLPGFVQYDRYQICNRCAIEYEVARMRGAVESPGQYVRDKRFGEEDLHALT